MFTRSCLFAALLGAILAGPTQGAVLISEVLYNEVGGDTNGEWIEIFNTGPGTVDLSNYKVGDEETMNPPQPGESGGMWQFPAGAMIAPGEVQIVGVGANRFNTVYGFNPTYEVVDTDPLIPNMTHYVAWSDNPSDPINMSNTNDQALLLDGSDTIADALSWGNTFAFNPALDPDAEVDGQTYERRNAFRDTNTAADWQLGNPSSPGTVLVPEPATMLMAMLAAIVGLLSRRGSDGP
jgi:Lamin Tail Domain